VWEVSACEERAERGGQGEGDRRGRGEGVSSEQRVSYRFGRQRGDDLIHRQPPFRIHFGPADIEIC